MRTVLVVADGPETADNLFFASATVPEDDGFEIGADLLARVLEAPEVLDDMGAVLTGALGLGELVDVVGFRTVDVDEVVPRFSAKDSDFPGELCAPEGAREVLRVVLLVNGFFLSSPEPPIDGCDLCEALEDVGAVALVGFRTVEPGTERTGGLVNPPVVRVADEEVGFVAEEVALFTPKIPDRFGGTASFLTPFALSFGGASLSVSVSTSDATGVASSLDWISAGVSSWGGTTGFSTSAMVTEVWIN